MVRFVLLERSGMWHPHARSSSRDSQLLGSYYGDPWSLAAFPLESVVALS